MKLWKKSISFKWDKKQDSTFNVLREKLCSAFVLLLPDFIKVFKIECDAFKIAIGVV